MCFPNVEILYRINIEKTRLTTKNYYENIAIIED